jgi:hypothetical protein
MKAKQLADLLEVIVRKVVREELKPILKEIKQSSKPVIKENKVKEITKPFDPLDVSDVLETERLKKQNPTMEFSKNPMLNEMLNETAESGEWRTMDSTFGANQAQGFNRQVMAEKLGYGSGKPTAQNMTPTIDPDGNPLNVNIEGTAVGDALTKDYSKLMKTINAKKGK